MGFITTSVRTRSSSTELYEYDDKDGDMYPETTTARPTSGILAHTRDESGELDGENQSVVELIDYFSDVYNVTISDKNRKKAHAQTAPRPNFLEEMGALESQIPTLHYPATVALTSYKADSKKLPIVLKNENASNGKQKYRIDTLAQLQRFMEWVDAYGNENDWLVQEWINTPSDAPSSYRVIVDPTGEVVTSQILYGASAQSGIRSNMQREGVASEPWKNLENPTSPYFLNAPSIASNRMFNADGEMIGGRVTLDRREESHPYGPRDKEILEAYGMDEDSAHLPEAIRSISEKIGKILGQVDGDAVQGDLILGIDFLQNEASGQSNLIEINRRPSMISIRDYLGSAHAMTKLGAWRWYLNRTMARIRQSS